MYRKWVKNEVRDVVRGQYMNGYKYHVKNDGLYPEGDGGLLKI